MGGGVCVGLGGGGGGAEGELTVKVRIHTTTTLHMGAYGSNLLGRERHYNRESCREKIYISGTNDGKHIKMQNCIHIG